MDFGGGGSTAGVSRCWSCGRSLAQTSSTVCLQPLPAAPAWTKGSCKNTAALRSKAPATRTGCGGSRGFGEHLLLPGGGERL